MFRTELPIAPATDQLPRTARVLTMGSCFADSIGSRLAANKVETLVNPFGTVFQPLALVKLLRAAAGEEVDWQQHLVQARGRWQSYDVHGSIGADSPVDLLQHIHELVRRTGDFLRNADVLLLTLGTAWTYRLRETAELVNNCHKQPADLFVRELLTPDEIINGLAETHAYLRRINPSLRFVLTVSPVRHLKDTLPLNSVSKSVLRVATHIVSDLLPGVAYFPAYELLLDELRDYRFYSADMLHPSEVAEDYIWDKFARTYLDVDFGRFRKEWASVRQSLGHRPLHAGAPEHRQFLENTLAKLEQLSLRKVAVTDELGEVKAKLAALPVPPQPAAEELVPDDEERIDIGESLIPREAQVSPQSEVPSPTENRLPRLSPEEFRSQRAARSGRPERGRRDGRGKGQAQAENEQFQGAAAFADDQNESPFTLIPPALVPAELGASEQILEQAAAIPSGIDAAAGADDGGKKKKRRSRGGAKRTARKNALRVASGEILPGSERVTTSENERAAPAPDAEAESHDIRPEGLKSSVITKSVPVKRGGRLNQLGRVPRAELYATPAEAPVESPIATEISANADAEAFFLGTVQPPIEAPAVISEIAAPVATNSKSRNGRNRGKKAPAQNIDAAPVEVTTSPAPVELAQSGSQGSMEPLSDTAEAVEPNKGQRNNRNQGEILPTAAPATPEGPIASGAEETTDARISPAQTPARRSNRAKRAVSGARAEKPAVDVAVVPVPNALEVRTQVAAGRMTGTSASLIEPTAPKKKTATVKKPASPKKAAAPKPRAVKPKVDSASSAPTPPETPAPAPKRKPAAKPKVAAARPTAPKLKAPRKPAKPA